MLSLAHYTTELSPQSFKKRVSLPSSISIYIFFELKEAKGNSICWKMNENKIDGNELNTNENLISHWKVL